MWKLAHALAASADFQTVSAVAEANEVDVMVVMREEDELSSAARIAHLLVRNENAKKQQG